MPDVNRWFHLRVPALSANLVLDSMLLARAGRVSDLPTAQRDADSPAGAMRKIPATREFDLADGARWRSRCDDDAATSWRFRTTFHWEGDGSSAAALTAGVVIADELLKWAGNRCAFWMRPRAFKGHPIMGAVHAGSIVASAIDRAG